MKVKIVTAAALALTALPVMVSAGGKGPKPSSDIAAPTGLSCMLGEMIDSATVDVWWDQVEDYMDYHVDFDCSYANTDGSIVEIEVDSEDLLIDCLAATEETPATCHTSIAIDPDFLVDTDPASEDDALLDLTVSGACLVSVKVKNTPGPRQNHAKTTAECDFTQPTDPRCAACHE